MKDVITFPDFEKLDLRVGRVVSCQRKEGSDKLYRLTVNFGEEGERTIFTGLAQDFEPSYLEGKKFVFIFNLAKRKMMDEFSEGMLLCAEGDKPFPLTTTEDVPEGSLVH